MKVLLDTYIILWALTDNEKLPQKAKMIISRKDNEIYYSTASIWEVTLKHMNHPEHMPISGRQMSDYCQKAKYHMLPVLDEHVYALEGLRRKEDAPRHKDPFDCIMIAQTKAEKMIFVTHDSFLPDYMEECVVFV